MKMDPQIKRLEAAVEELKLAYAELEKENSGIWVPMPANIADFRELDPRMVAESVQRQLNTHRLRKAACAKLTPEEWKALDIGRP